MSDKIRMTHPDLDGQVIYQRPQQVAVRKASGWVEAPEEGNPAAVEQPAPAPAAPATTRAARVAPTQES